MFWSLSFLLIACCSSPTSPMILTVSQVYLAMFLHTEQISTKLNNYSLQILLVVLDKGMK